MQEPTVTAGMTIRGARAKATNGLVSDSATKSWA